MEERVTVRLTSNVDAACRSPAVPVQAKILNLSQDGCLACAIRGAVSPGSTVLLDLSPRLQTSGEVIWCDESKFGVKFHNRISFEAVASHSSLWRR